MKINVSEIVENKLKQLDEDKVIERQIEQSIETTILKAVKDALEDYSLKRDIEKQLIENISAITANVGFDAYNSFIADTIRKSVIEASKEDIRNKIASSFESIFIKKYENIKLSEIFKQYRELFDDVEYSDRARTEDGYTYSLIKEDDSDGSFKHATIVWALESQKRDATYSYSGNNDYKLVMHLMEYKNGGYTITSISWEGKDITKKDSLYLMSNFEALMASLYFNKTKIEVDMDEYDMNICLVDY